MCEKKCFVMSAFCIGQLTSSQPAWAAVYNYVNMLEFVFISTLKLSP